MYTSSSLKPRTMRRRSRDHSEQAGRLAWITRITLGLLLMLGTAQTGAAQTSAPALIDTNLPDAVLYADSLRLGRVGEGLVHVPAWARMLRLVPEVDAWSVEPLMRPLPASAFEETTGGDTLRLSMRFPYHYAIESVPFGASVYLEEENARAELGTTPLVYRAEAPLTGVLVVERQGYGPVRLEPGADVWNREVLVLEPLIPAGVATVEMDWNPPAPRRRWIDVAALGLAAVGGATAVYYKFKADDRYDVYQETGDPALRPEIRRYDLYSGVALGAMQVGVGVFALRLVLR